MKRLVLLLLLIALPISAAEDAKIFCDDEVCAMSVETFRKLADYLMALERKVDELRATSGCS